MLVVFSTSFFCLRNQSIQKPWRNFRKIVLNQDFSTYFSMNWRIARICNIGDQFLRKLFWFSKEFSPLQIKCDCETKQVRVIRMYFLVILNLSLLRKVHYSFVVFYTVFQNRKTYAIIFSRLLYSRKNFVDDCSFAAFVLFLFLFICCCFFQYWVKFFLCKLS